MKIKTKRKNLVNGEKGITLIALVVTIIVLLILAGISISMLTGQNGILNRAQEAKNKTEQAEKEEKEKLGDMEDILNEYTTGIEIEQVTDENPGVLEGVGTSEDPYTINSIEDLVFFASNVTNGTTYEGQTVKLGLSLDFNSNKSYVEPLRTDYAEYGYDGELKTLLTTGEGFSPIGTTYDATISNNYFCGTFDGDNNSIYNLYENIENSEYVTIAGLFSTNGGTIKNLKLENVSLKGTTNNLHLLIGGIAGRNNNGNIQQCSTSGNITLIANGIKGTYVGGINAQPIGEENIIDKCSSNVNIHVTSVNESINSACVIGIGSGKISNCYFSGNLDIDGKILGGKTISGIGMGEIKNSYNIGTIKNKTNYNNSGDAYVSGIMYGGGNISYCYNTGEIICENPKMYISGICSNAQNGEINNCYNIGKIEGTGTTIIGGSLIGYASNQKILNSKWLTGTFDKAIGNKVGECTEDVEEINSIENMPSIISVINQENCFKEDVNNINNGYPILNWQ